MAAVEPAHGPGLEACHSFSPPRPGAQPARKSRARPDYQSVWLVTASSGAVLGRGQRESSGAPIRVMRSLRTWRRSPAGHPRFRVVAEPMALCARRIRRAGPDRPARETAPPAASR